MEISSNRNQQVAGYLAETSNSPLLVGCSAERSHNSVDAASFCDPDLVRVIQCEILKRAAAAALDIGVVRVRADRSENSFDAAGCRDRFLVRIIHCQIMKRAAAAALDVTMF